MKTDKNCFTITQNNFIELEISINLNNVISKSTGRCYQSIANLSSNRDFRFGACTAVCPSTIKSKPGGQSAPKPGAERISNPGFSISMNRPMPFNYWN